MNAQLENKLNRCLDKQIEKEKTTSLFIWTLAIFLWGACFGIWIGS